MEGCLPADMSMRLIIHWKYIYQGTVMANLLYYLRIRAKGTDLDFASSYGAMRVDNNGQEGLLVLLLNGLGRHVNA